MKHIIAHPEMAVCAAMIIAALIGRTLALLGF